MLARIICSNMLGESEAGPMVQTIFVSFFGSLIMPSFLEVPDDSLQGKSIFDLQIPEPK
jgi:hypothetical protein